METLDEVLEHFGVKGMKWGVRRDKTTGVRPIAKTLEKSKFGVASAQNAQRHIDKKSAKADKKWEKKVYSFKGAVAIHNHVADQMNHGMLDKLNNHPKYVGKNLNTNSKLRDQYYKDYEKLSTQAYNKAVKDIHGASPSGKKVAVYIPDPDFPRVEIHDRAAVHAETVTPDLVINVKLDSNGMVIEAAEAELKHFDSVDDVLEHFGVRGMKWGVRKNRSLKEPASTDAKNAHESKLIIKKSGTKALNNKELQALVTRMNLEQQYSTLTSKRVNPGKKFAKELLIGFAKSQAQSTFNTYAAKGVSAAMSGSMRKSASKVHKVNEPKSPTAFGFEPR